MSNANLIKVFLQLLVRSHHIAFYNESLLTIYRVMYRIQLLRTHSATMY